MSNELVYNIKALTKDIKAKRDEHAAALEGDQKKAEEAVLALAKKFLKGGGKPVATDKPVLVRTGVVTLDEYDALLADLALLDGENVQGDVLKTAGHNVIRLTREAGKTSVNKTIVNIG